MKTDYLYGLHSVEARLQTTAPHVAKLFILKSRRDQRLQKILELAKQQQIPVEMLDVHALENIVGDVNHQGVIAEVNAVEPTRS